MSPIRNSINKTPNLNWAQKAGAKLFRLSTYTSPANITSDPDENEWQPLGTSPRDLPAFDQDYMQQLALHLYRANPIARRIVKLTRAFVAGEGIVIRCKDPQVDAALRYFWNTPLNNWRWRFPERVESLSIYGEAAYPVMKDPITGRILLGNMSPTAISKILVNPLNTLDATHLVTKEGYDINMQTVPSKALPLVRVIDDPNDPLYGYRDGQMMYWGINKSLDMNRGVSDLYSMADWLGIFDGILFSRAERQHYMSSWWNDITIEGADQEEIDGWVSRQLIAESKQRTGRYRAHNEKVKWSTVAPQFSPSSDEKEVEYIFRMIWGGSGMASTAFGESEAGRTNAAEMNEFTFKSLTDVQVIWRNILMDIFDLVMDQAVFAGTLPSKVDKTIEIFMPKISMRDLQRSTSALRNLSTSIRLLTDEKMTLLTDKDKQRMRAVFHSLLDHIDQSSANMYELQDPVTKEQTDLEKESHNGAFIAK